MKIPFASLALAILCISCLANQSSNNIKIERISPYDVGVPGQMLELRVTGFGESFVLLNTDGFRIEVVQDGIGRQARLRSITPIFERLESDRQKNNTADGSLKLYQNFLFTVPHGLHEGEAEVVLYYNKQRSAIRLKVGGKARAPAVGSIMVATFGPGGEVPDFLSNGKDSDVLGFRLEKGHRAELSLSPLVDPDDQDAAVLVNFKQGSLVSRAISHVVRTEVKGASLAPSRYVLNIDVPSDLAAGKANMEVQIQANGQIGEPVVLPVLIVDSSLAGAFPKASSPRLLNVSPTRVGIGQSISLSVDHRRTLEPDPSKVLVVIEQGAIRVTVAPELNTALLQEDMPEDTPVLLIARLTAEIVGPAKVRVLNPAREDGSGASEPLTLEVINQVIAPVVASVTESTDADLAPLRQMRETAIRGGREFRDYDPKSRYVTIQATGLDFNPNFVRITIQQDSGSYTLSYDDFSLSAGSVTIVRLPEEIKPGIVQITVENRGGDGERYSSPIEKSFAVTHARK